MIDQTELADVGWLWPAYMSRGAVAELIGVLRSAPAEQRRIVLESALPRFYSPAYLASMVTGRYPVVPVVRDFQTQISQGIEAAMAGLYAAAVSTLLPAVEGILRGIGGMDGRIVNTKAKNLSAEFDHMIARELKVQYDAETTGERIAMLKGFQDFFNRHLFEHTQHYAGTGELNRHGILHGLFQRFGDRANFCILVSIIDHLTFSMTLRTSGVSALAPDDTEVSRQLTRHYLRLQAIAVARPTGAGTGSPSRKGQRNS